MISVILLAGGKGTRMQQPLPKQYLLLNQQPLILYSLKIFAAHPEVAEIIVVADKAYHPYYTSYPVRFAEPGSRRQDSVYNALQRVSPLCKWVCIHDGVRPFITSTMVSTLFEEGKKVGAAAFAMPVKNTLKVVSSDSMVISTPDRAQFWEVQTPQFLKKEVIEKGFTLARQENRMVTDDVSLAELIHHPVLLLEGGYRNIKITTPEDLRVAHTFLQDA